MLTEDWLVVASVGCILLALAALATIALGELGRRRRLRAIRQRRSRQLLLLPVAGPEDWAWPRFPERVAAQIAEMEQ